MDEFALDRRTLSGTGQLCSNRRGCAGGALVDGLLEPPALIGTVAERSRVTWQHLGRSVSLLHRAPPQRGEAVTHSTGP